MKYAVKTFALITIALTLSSCSNQMVYNMIQSSQRTQCALLPKGQEQQCLEGYQLSYGEYIAARKEHDLLEID